MTKIQGRQLARKRRHKSIRKKVTGTPEKPRLNVSRSLKHIHAQVIDDYSGHTLAAASTLDPSLREELTQTSNAEAARRVGELLAQRAKDKGINQVVFDRGGFKYHGRVKALADGAREKGLQF